MMCTAKSSAHRVWKGIFLAADSVALLGALYATAWIVSYRFYCRHYITWASGHLSVRIIGFCEHWMIPMIWSFIPALLFLLIVSPFFARSALRPVAVTGWI